MPGRLLPTKQSLNYAHLQSEQLLLSEAHDAGTSHPSTQHRKHALIPARTPAPLPCPQRKRLEPFEVPKSGAFWLHDDRFEAEEGEGGAGSGMRADDEQDERQQCVPVVVRVVRLVMVVVAVLLWLPCRRSYRCTSQQYSGCWGCSARLQSGAVAAAAASGQRMPASPQSLALHMHVQAHASPLCLDGWLCAGRRASCGTPAARSGGGTMPLRLWSVGRSPLGT